MHDVTVIIDSAGFLGGGGNYNVHCRTCGYGDTFSAKQLAMMVRNAHAAVEPVASPIAVTESEEQANERAWRTRRALADAIEEAAAVSSAMARLEAALRRLV
jgi:ubiquinone biosynthesis protein UbiJ